MKIHLEGVALSWPPAGEVGTWLPERFRWSWVLHRAGLWMVFLATSWAAGHDVPVTFQHRTSTVPGQSVFVLGNLPQLGSWVPNRAIKMVPSNCSGSECDWTVTIALPAGVSYEYKFVKRWDCACCWDDPNISCYGRTDPGSTEYEPGPNRTGNTPPAPPPPCPGKTVFYISSWSSVSILFSNTQTAAWELRPMLPVRNGVWRADGLNRMGETNLVFVFTDNTGNWDNPDGVPGRNYETPLDACVVQAGQIYNYWPPPVVSTNRVESFFITPSNGLQPRTVRVYLPRGYDQNTTKRYPVLYMQDGQNLFLGMGAFGSWNVDTNVTNLIRFGKLRELIVVGVENATDRACEYTPCALSSCAGKWATAQRYAEFLINDVKAYVDTHYRTLTDPANTGIMGSSRGGLISVYLGWEYPHVFGKVGALSPSFWACATTMNNLAVPPKRPIRIYLDTGTVGDFPVSDPPCNPCYDGLVQTMTARDNLIRNGYVIGQDLLHVFGFGHNHNEYWWDRRSPQAYLFLFPTRDEPNTVLDTHACPPRVTGFDGNQIAWTAYRGRAYTLQGTTNEQFRFSVTWSNLSQTAPLPVPWDYLQLPVAEPHRFFRIRQDALPAWPE